MVNTGERTIEFSAPGLAVEAHHYITETGAADMVGTSVSTYASMEHILTPDVDLWVRAVEFTGTIDGGDTLVAKICSDDGSNNIGAVLATSASYTAGADNVDNRVWLFFDADVELTKGTKYYVLICWSNAPSGTTALALYSDSVPYPIPNRNDSTGYARVAEVDPGPGDAVNQSTTGTPFVIGYMYRTADTPAISGMMLDAGIEELSDVTLEGTPADDEVIAYDLASGSFANRIARGSHTAYNWCENSRLFGSRV